MGMEHVCQNDICWPHLIVSISYMGMELGESLHHLTVSLVSISYMGMERDAVWQTITAICEGSQSPIWVWNANSRALVFYVLQEIVSISYMGMDHLVVVRRSQYDYY